MCSDDNFVVCEASLTDTHLLLASPSFRSAIKTIKYKLRKLHAVTSDSEVFKRVDQFYSAKVIYAGGVHRRLFFSSYANMNHFIEVVVDA